MDPRTATTVGDMLRRLPPTGAGRDLALLRLADVCAEREATAAVRAAAARARETLRQGGPDGEVVANAVSAASALADLGSITPPAVDVDLAADALRRDELSRALVEPSFLAVIPAWISELRQVASTAPGSGACTVASAMQLWSWTVSHVQNAARDASASELAQAFVPLIAARAQILEVVLEGTAANGAAPAHQFYTDLCHVQAARAAGTVGSLCAEIVFGSREHPAWDAQGCASCYRADDLDSLEGLIPGIASSARAHSDVIESDGSHPAKAGPCAKADGLDTFIRLRTKLDGCLTGARVAKARAAAALPSVLASANVSTR
jgi:hypothetical protein